MNKIRNIVTRFKSLTALGLATIASNAISGLFWLYMARLLGTANYGEVSYLIAISAIGAIVSFFGAGSSLTVYTAKEVKIQPALYFVTLVASSIAALVLFFIFKNLAVSLYVIGNVVFGLVTYELLGKKSFMKYSMYLITQKILATTLAILLYYVIGLNGIILGLALSFFPYSFDIYTGLRASKIDLFAMRTKLGFIINTYMLDLARTFATTADKLIVASILGYDLLGNYQLAAQILTILGILPGVVYYYILPQDSSGKPNNKLKKMTVFGSIILAALGILLSPIILPVLFPKFKDAIEVVQIMSLSIIFVTINSMFISKFLGMEKSKIVLVGSGIYLGLQIPLIILLGKVFGVNGVAASIVLATMAESVYLVSMNRVFNTKKPKEEDIGMRQNYATQVTTTTTKKESIFPIKIILALSAIGIVSLLLRIHYFPFNIPLILDALNDYFFYATDLSILGHLPSGYTFANNGWPIFLSFFFTIFRFDNFLDYVTLQRFITVALSVLTIIPVYFLCSRFIERPYAIAGASLFAFDPRIIQNSLLGITEPLYILLLSIAFALYFSSRTKLIYISFVLVALSSIVRAEGLFIFVPMIIMFYLRHMKEDKIVTKVILAVAIFVMLILPIALLRIYTIGNDALTARISEGTSEILSTSHHTGTFVFLKTGIENVVKLGAWSLVPIFIVLFPIGLYFFVKERDIDKLTVLVIIVLALLPVFYAFLLNQDTRFMYPLFPLFSVVSALTVKKILGKTKRQNLVLIIIIGIILLASTAFLEYKKFDYDHQKEAFEIAYRVTGIAGGVNAYYPEDSYITPAEVPEKWPVLKSSIDFKTTLIPINGFNSITGFIQSSEKKGLTHLVVDGQADRPSFLNDVFYHAERYPYLVEVYDSSEHGFRYHVKIFKIDYNLFNSLIR